MRSDRPLRIDPPGSRPVREGAVRDGGDGVSMGSGSLPSALLLGLLLALLPLAGCASTPPGPTAATVSGSPAASPTAAVAPSVSLPPVGAPTTAPSPSTTVPSPTPSAVPATDPFVPVVAFRSPTVRVGWNDLRAAAGGGGRWSGLALVEAEADAILAALRIERPTDPSRLTLVADPTALAAELRANPDQLGFISARSVGPSFRALAWGKRSLFGVDRVRDIAAWPLRAAIGSASHAGGASEGGAGAASDGSTAAFDPSTLWTMWAGGDLAVERGLWYTIRTLGLGIDFPFDGGTARITGSRCCSAFGWPIPTIARTGNDGAVRALISGADVAIANLEGSIPDQPRFHPSGTVFTGDRAFLPGLVSAGIDVVTMANNHVGDAGRQGVVQSVRNVAAAGLLHAGAGSNLAAARKPAVVEIAGTRVAFLSYDAIAAGPYGATADAPGSAPLRTDYVRRDVAAARKKGADVVVVLPHWGVEYIHGPSAWQRRVGREIAEAGADLVIGNHQHWPGAMEVHEGVPIWYSLGNFTFDQNWAENVMLGYSLELTFRGATLVQARLHPHVTVDRVQPNLLDPAGDGRRVLEPVFAASGDALSW